jgi:hypothetical protein
MIIENLTRFYMEYEKCHPFRDKLAIEIPDAKVTVCSPISNVHYVEIQYPNVIVSVKS